MFHYGQKMKVIFEVYSSQLEGHFPRIPCSDDFVDKTIKGKSILYVVARPKSLEKFLKVADRLIND